MQVEEQAEEAARPSSVEGSLDPCARPIGMWDDDIGDHGFMPHSARNHDAYGLFQDFSEVNPAESENIPDPSLGIQVLRCVRTHWPADVQPRASWCCIHRDYATDPHFFFHSHCTLTGLFAVDWDAPCSTSARSGAEHRTTGVNLHPYHVRQNERRAEDEIRSILRQDLEFEREIQEIIGREETASSSAARELELGYCRYLERQRDDYTRGRDFDDMLARARMRDAMQAEPVLVEVDGDDASPSRRSIIGEDQVRGILTLKERILAGDAAAADFRILIHFNR